MNDSSSNAAFQGVKLIKSHHETPAEPLEELFDAYYQCFSVMNAFDRACYKDPDVSKRRDVLFVESDHAIFDAMWSQIRSSRRTRFMKPMIEAAISEYKNRRRKCDGALKRQSKTRYRSIPIPSMDIACHILKNFNGAPQSSARNLESARLIRDRHQVGTYFLRVPVLRRRTQEPDKTKDDVGLYFDADGLYIVAENQQSQYTGSQHLSVNHISTKKFVQHFYRVAAMNARQISIEVGNKLGGEMASIRRLFLRYGRLLNAEGALAVRPVASSHASVNVPTICPRCGRAVSRRGIEISLGEDHVRCDDCRLTYKRQHVLAAWALTEGRSRSGSVWSEAIVPNDVKDTDAVGARTKKSPNTNIHTETKTKLEASQELRGPVQPGRSNDDDGLIYAYQPSFKEVVRARAALVDTRSSACIDTTNGRTIRSTSQLELTRPIVVELDRTSKRLVNSHESANEAEQVYTHHRAIEHTHRAIEHTHRAIEHTHRAIEYAEGEDETEQVYIHRAIEHAEGEDEAEQVYIHHAIEHAEGEDDLVIEIHIPNPNVLRDPLTGEVLRRKSRPS